MQRCKWPSSTAKAFEEPLGHMWSVTSELLPTVTSGSLLITLIASGIGMAHMHHCWRRHYCKFHVESLLECTTELCIDESLVCLTEILWEVLFGNPDREATGPKLFLNYFSKSCVCNGNLQCHIEEEMGRESERTRDISIYLSI